MNIKKLLISAVLPVLFLTTAVAQEVEQGDNTPKKNDFTMAATVGYNSFTSVQALPGGQNSYSASAFSTDWSDKKLMVGIEGGWFMTDLWKLTLGGGLTFTNNPSYSGMDAIYMDENMILPGYEAVTDAYTFGYNVNLGVDRYFRLKGVKNLMLYTGLRAGFAYALNEQKYDEWTSMGKSTAETWNLRGSLTFGADYFVLPGMFVGLSVDVGSYTYNMTTYKPQEGLANLSADSHNVGFLAAPTIKVGFVF